MVDTLDHWVYFKALREGCCVLAKGWHPYVEGAHAAFQKIAVVRVRASTEVDLTGEDLSNVFLGTNDGAPNNIGMPTEVLCGRVDHQIDAHVERLAGPR